jgi:hypothetical protein
MILFLFQTQQLFAQAFAGYAEEFCGFAFVASRLVHDPPVSHLKEIEEQNKN